ncbi:hypothetical protein [Dinoroseobacter sp. S375]|uniref:hypothetical protein n=1 Tax=Dinoroseobacter sp. S375 TaxID=3415136 RepID=UPI003C7B83F7
MTALAGTSAMTTGSARISGRAFGATSLRDRTLRGLAETAAIAQTARAPSVRAIAVPLTAAKPVNAATTPALRARGLDLRPSLARRAGRVGPSEHARRISDD